MSDETGAETSEMKESKQCKCRFCEEGKRHPLFAYLLTHAGEGDASPTVVGRSKNPVQRLCEHNREPGYSKGGRRTGNIKGKWQLEMVIGPYFTSTSVKAAHERWSKERRGVLNRIRLGGELAAEQAKRLTEAKSEHQAAVYVRDDGAVQRALALDQATGNGSLESKGKKRQLKKAPPPVVSSDTESESNSSSSDVDSGPEPSSPPDSPVVRKRRKIAISDDDDDEREAGEQACD